MASLQQAKTAFVRQFSGLRPNYEFKPFGYVQQVEDNLVPSVTLDLFQSDFQRGAGHELKAKARAVYSSAMLAVNTFARWKAEPGSLLPLKGSTKLNFEVRCRTGLGGTPPHLDLLAESPDAVVGVESKCLEHFSPHKPSFSDSYKALKKRVGDSRWYKQIAQIRAKPNAYRHLDVAQLIKHYLGLWNCYPDKTKTLVYLFWEPVNHDAIRECRLHREELARFSEAVAGDAVAFCSASYPCLWESWTREATPAWLGHHLQCLRDRYLFEM